MDQNHSWGQLEAPDAPEPRDTLRFPFKKTLDWGRDSPSGLVVKFGRLHFSCLDSVTGRRPTPLLSSQAVTATHIQNRERLAQMLAQGESSSSKKRKIGNRCQLRANLPQQQQQQKE